jgi:hypothetical protein
MVKFPSHGKETDFRYHVGTVDAESKVYCGYSLLPLNRLHVLHTAVVLLALTTTELDKNAIGKIFVMDASGPEMQRLARTR